MSKGRLIGIGIGPGDPDLMTVKAMDAIMAAPVVAHMHATGKAGIAFETVRAVVDDDADVIAIPVPMAADEDDRRQAYAAAMPDLRAYLDDGRDVAFVCEGDALFYGSFQYVMDALGDDYAVEVIPGVTSVSASAAASRFALTRGDDIFQVLPATLPDGALAVRLGAMGTAFAILKLGRHVGRVKAILERLGRLDGAVVVEKATWDDERITPLTDYEGDAPYFAQVLVPARGPVVALPSDVVIVCLNQAGIPTAKAIKARLERSRIWGLAGRVEEADADMLFDDVVEQLQGLYRTGLTICAVMASGIVIRALGPILGDKREEPPVVAVSTDGGYAVPLLGGHRGANRLAHAISEITQGFAAVTTASDTALGLALDDPPPRWSVANPENVKAIAAKLLSGERVGLTMESGEDWWFRDAPMDRVEHTAGADVIATHRAIDLPGQSLILHPPTLALGVGCARGCPPEELSELVHGTLKTAGLAKESIACVVSIDVKADEPAVLALADELGVPARFFTAEELNEQADRLKNPSKVVMAEVGCPGVAEGAALAAVELEGDLLVEKKKTVNATCAVALAPKDLHPSYVGKGRGRLFVVGIGPGAESWRTPEVTRVLRECTDIVGFGFYLDLVHDLIAGKVLHKSSLGEEEARVREALELAAEGKDVALVSSGDVGIYAMAALVFELLEREDRADWNRLYIQVEPGISAFQAAAARIGAPVGHDFCLISLSDLLTPWDVIEKRLKAAAEGGFVVAFYNPVSQRRRTQLAHARDVLLAHRAPETPVVLARQLGRPDEDIRIKALKDLDVDDADMLTLVMVGGDNTRAVTRGENTWVYTPRGYGVKMDGNFTPGGD